MSDEPSNLCMLCGNPAIDTDDVSEWYTEGIYWVYCKACDCWTEHPVEPTGLPRQKGTRI